MAKLIEWDAEKYCKAPDDNNEMDQADRHLHRDFADACVDAQFPVVTITFPLDESSATEHRFVCIETSDWVMVC